MRSWSWRRGSRHIPTNSGDSRNSPPLQGQTTELKHEKTNPTKNDGVRQQSGVAPLAAPPFARLDENASQFR
jgi:hypothetical protein